LVREGSVLYTFGNASGISREDNLVVIQPKRRSSRADEARAPGVTDLGGKIVEGNLRPSSDLPTHLVLYRASSEMAESLTPIPSTATSWGPGAPSIHALAQPTPTIFMAGSGNRSDVGG